MWRETASKQHLVENVADPSWKQKLDEAQKRLCSLSNLWEESKAIAEKNTVRTTELDALLQNESYVWSILSGYMFGSSANLIFDRFK